MRLVDNQKHADQKRLFKAATENDFQTIADLVAKGGIDINSKSNHGRSALIIALENKSSEAALMLIHHKADVTAAAPVTGRQPLAIACAKGMQQVVERLITAGAPLEAQADADGDTALMQAIKQGDGWAACRLVAAGAEIDTRRNHAGKTAGQLAPAYLGAADYAFFKALVEKQQRQQAETAAQAMADNIRDATVLQREIAPLKRLHFRLRP